MAVSSVDGSYGMSAPNTRTAPNSSTLDMDSFMLLLAKQLQNQDLNNPMSNAEMMQQLTSMATVQSMNTFTELSSTQYALGLMGQTIRVAATDEVTNAMTVKEGKVTGINLSDMLIYIEGSKEGYGLGNVMEVGVVPKKEDEEDKDDDKTDTDKDPVKPETPTPQSGSAKDGTVSAYSSRMDSGSDISGQARSASSSKFVGSRLSERAIQMANSSSIDPDKAEALRIQSMQTMPEDKMRALEAQQLLRSSRLEKGPGYQSGKTSTARI